MLTDQYTCKYKYLINKKDAIKYIYLININHKIKKRSTWIKIGSNVRWQAKVMSPHTQSPVNKH
jgi:hypothetical protein